MFEYPEWSATKSRSLAEDLGTWDARIVFLRMNRGRRPDVKVATAAFAAEIA